MDNNYIIEVTMSDTGEIKYLTTWNDLISDPNEATRYTKHSVAAEHKIENLPKSLNPRLVDRRMLIGTYISTYKDKYRLSNILEKIEANNFLFNIITIILLPITLPILGILILKDKIKEYVTNHR